MRTGLPSSIQPLTPQQRDRVMDPSIVFEKTAKGEEALRHRDESLPSDLRSGVEVIYENAHYTLLRVPVP